MVPGIDKELDAFFRCGVATVVGTRDANLAPEIARGWGIRLLSDLATVELCIGLPSGRRTLDNLADNGLIAVTCVRPSDYKQVQLKGRAIETLDPDAEDREHIAHHRREFAREVEGVGIAQHICHGFWSHDDPHAMAKVRFRVDEAFDQTPGPGAGRPL